MDKLTKTILVIEDEVPLLAAIKTKLEHGGFNVVTGRTVGEALTYLKEVGNVDAIWLDHYLIGKENGLDLVTKLKGYGGDLARIPIFVVSNTASHEKVQSYIHFGIKKYYVKAEHRLDVIINDIKTFLDNPEE